MATLVAGVGGYLAATFIYQENATEGPFDQQDKGATIAERERRSVDLYFADATGSYLVAETRGMPDHGTATRNAKEILQLLFQGPQRHARRTLPPATVLRALYLTSEGTAVVDLAPAVRDNHPGGIQSELLAVYSMVNSLILNIPEIKHVKLLIEGRETTTLGGHIRLHTRMRANLLLIR